MILEYLDLISRIHQELGDLESVVVRAEQGIQAARHHSADQDL